MRRDRTQVRHAAALDALPDGAMIERRGEPGTAWLVRGDRLRRWSFSGYAASAPRPAGENVLVLTPALTVAVLGAGYAASVHPTAPG